MKELVDSSYIDLREMWSTTVAAYFHFVIQIGHLPLVPWHQHYTGTENEVLL